MTRVSEAAGVATYAFTTESGMRMFWVHDVAAWHAGADLDDTPVEPTRPVVRMRARRPARRRGRSRSPDDDGPSDPGARS